MNVLSRLTIWVLLLAFASLGFAQDEELLEPDKAFALTVTAVDDSNVNVNWKIADGYYMYRDKFKFVVSDGAILSSVDYPDGKMKHDELFGDVEVYLKEADFNVQLTDAKSDITLKLTGQGCNEPVGVCYPPIIKDIALSLPISTALAATPASLPDTDTPTPAASPVDNAGAVAELKSLLGDLTGGDEFLSVDQAFQVEIQDIDGSNLEASFVIADGYYLYKDKVDFTVDQGDARINRFILPEGKLKHDEYFGEMMVYLKDFKAQIPLVRNKPEATSIKITAAYQGCADKGICYPPEKKQFTLELPQLIKLAEASENTPPATESAPDKTSTGDKTFIGL